MLYLRSMGENLEEFVNIDKFIEVKPKDLYYTAKGIEKGVRLIMLPSKGREVCASFLKFIARIKAIWVK
jgi:hypothetical protein